MTSARVVIVLTPAQRALIRQASGKNVAELGIEPLDSGSGWLYAPGGSQRPWLLKHPDPESYQAARKRKPRIDPRYASFRLKIGESRIHHLGIFAAERIPARRNVIEYIGEVVNAVESYRRTKDAEETYLLKIDEFWRVDGAVGGSGAEFINHSCDPNLRWTGVRNRVLCQSIRPIEVGEELTLDYHFSIHLPKVRCLCGSPKCRGTINVVKSGRAKRRTKKTMATTD